MSPSNGDRRIVAMDSSRTDPSKLNGKVVVAWHRGHGLVALFRRIDGVQILESENREYESLPFVKDRNWRISGKVLWWIRQAP